MKKYNVIINETFEVEAEDENEARQKGAEMMSHLLNHEDQIVVEEIK